MESDRASSISGTRTMEELAEFWEGHSLSDYDGLTHKVETVFDPSARRTAVTIEPELLQDLSYLARQRKISTQTLINVWLRQQVDRFLSQPTNMGGNAP